MSITRTRIDPVIALLCERFPKTFFMLERRRVPLKSASSTTWSQHLATPPGIVTDAGPKPSAPGREKLWQTRIDNAMTRYIKRAKKQDGYYVATLGLKGVRGFIKEGKAAR